MFAPNVWSFDAPNTQIAHKYSESNEKHEKQICKRIHSHPFNRVVRNCFNGTLIISFNLFNEKIFHVKKHCNAYKVICVHRQPMQYCFARLFLIAEK